MTENQVPPKTVLYHMDIDTAMVFFEICNSLNIEHDDIASKTIILDELMSLNKGMMKVEYAKTVDDVLEHVKDKFGKAVYITNSNQDTDSDHICPWCNKQLVLTGYGWKCVNPSCPDKEEK